MLYIILLILCIVFPEMTINTTKETVQLWANSIVPSLLPFFIISKCIYYNDGVKIFSKILKPITKFLRLPEQLAFPIAMSLMCGYQTGSRTIASMNIKKNINTYANICFCGNPIFIIGTIGTVILKNVSLGYALYVIHICTFLICTTFCKTKDNDDTNIETSKGSLATAISESTISVLIICGYMVLYNTIIKISTFFLPENFKVLFSGIIEFTTGIKGASSIYNNPMPLISFFLSFGGICVITQCLSVLKNVNKFYYVVNRIVSGLIASSLCIIYEKTAIYIPILITAVILIIGYIIRRKKVFTD